MTTEASAASGQGAATATAAAATTTAATTTTTATTTSASTAPAITWLEGADEVTVGYVQNKGWQSPADLLKSYQGAEKLIGVPPDKVVRLPNDTSTKEDLDAFYTKLGRPTESKDYGLKVPDGVDPSFMNAAATKFHELGLSTKQAQELQKWYDGQATAIGETQKSIAAQENVAQQNALKQEWGAAFDAKITQARMFAQQAGVDAATLDKMQQAMGYDGVMKFMANLGAKIGEANFPAGERGTSFGALTPGQAQAEIKSLQNDKEFRAKYLAGNTEAKAKMANLMKYAYPDQ